MGNAWDNFSFKKQVFLTTAFAGGVVTLALNVRFHLEQAKWWESQPYLPNAAGALTGVLIGVPAGALALATSAVQQETAIRKLQSQRSRNRWTTRSARALFIMFVVVMLLLMAYLLIRSKIFTGSSISDVQYNALWVFVASALATSVTLIGLLLGRAHNERMLAFQMHVDKHNRAEQEVAAKRQTLDTVVRGLELITASDGTYAAKARIAGSLAALIHLDHPVIAMRTLNAAWLDSQVDPATAVWLINEVLSAQNTSDSSKIEAARLLTAHAHDLCACANGQKGEYEWPEILKSQWLSRLPRDARFEILFATVSVLVSRPRDWWEAKAGWVGVILHEAFTNDEDPILRRSAYQLLAAFIAEYEYRGARWPWRGGVKTIPEIQRHLRGWPTPKFNTARTSDLVKKLEAWPDGV